MRRRDALTLVYQPIVNVETGAMMGAEALVRWRNENGQDVGPDVFVALQEPMENRQAGRGGQPPRGARELAPDVRAGVFRGKCDEPLAGSCGDGPGKGTRVPGLVSGGGRSCHGGSRG